MIALFIFTIFDKDKLLKKRKRQQKKQENKN
jgi:hypothetical protein